MVALAHGIVRLLLADSRRRNQGSHQQDGYRGAMEQALQHGFSLPK
jgi:hypothetical protein